MGDSPKIGQKQQTERKEKKRLNDGDNNGQATHGARKPPGPICFAHIYPVAHTPTKTFRPLPGNLGS